jgi:cytochrome P450
VVTSLLPPAGVDQDTLLLQRPAGNALVVNTAELAGQLLAGRADSFSKGPIQEAMFREVLGRSLSMAEGPEHTRLRRLLAPLFGRAQAHQTLPALATAFHAATRHWYQAPDLDPFTALGELTIRSVGTTLIADRDLRDDAVFHQARTRLWQRMNEVAARGCAPDTAPGRHDTLTADDGIHLIRAHRDHPATPVTL